MAKKSRGDYLTPKEIIAKYPALEEVHGITEHTLGTFLKTHVLWGRYESGKRHAKIREDSVIRLIKFLDDGLISMVILNKGSEE